MTKERLEAFSDGVMAVAITIMVLDMKVPAGADLRALAADAPVFAAYALSYANVGIFWNNHHHMLRVSQHIDGRVLWANLFLLFWITLIPFEVRWIDDTHIAALPTATYGLVLIMSAFGYLLLERALIAVNGPNSELATALGDRRKEYLSLALYIAAVGLAFFRPWIAIAIYAAVAAMWFIPDRRIESQLKA
ncbi:MAG TPA: TMEM175 family protein [Caulobacteraceae bacterium]